MRIEVNNDEITVFLDGELDAHNADIAKSEIMQIISDKNPASLVFDAKKLNYISSAGLRVLLATQKKLEKKVSVINISKDVMGIFKIACFDSIMNLKSVD